MFLTLLCLRIQMLYFVLIHDTYTLQAQTCHIHFMSYHFTVFAPIEIKKLLRAEREARSEFFCGLREKSQYARPDPTQPDPTRPDPVTLLRSLYLSNELTDSRAVFFVRCHHSINFVFDRHRYPPVPATARGTCRGEGVGDTLSIGNSTTAGPIAFKFGVCLETS